MPTCKPFEDIPKPRVMVIQSATVEQMQRIGKYCGSIGVTGTVKTGTLNDVYLKERYKA